MLNRCKSRKRSAATLVESAILYPVTFLLILGLMVGGLGVFRYQEVAALARSGARYASTHGAQFREDTAMPIGTAGTSAGTSGGILWYKASPTQPPGTDTSWTGLIYDNGVRPYLVALDTSKVACTIGWPPVINLPNNPDNWPGSTVTVTVSYQWLPELYLVGPLTLTSTSTMPITN